MAGASWARSSWRRDSSRGSTSRARSRSRTASRSTRARTSRPSCGRSSTSSSSTRCSKSPTNLTTRRTRCSTRARASSRPWTSQPSTSRTRTPRGSRSSARAVGCARRCGRTATPAPLQRPRRAGASRKRSASTPRCGAEPLPPRSMRRFLLIAGLFAAAAMLMAPLSQACSRSDTLFYETFLDLSCLQQPLVNTTLDAQGGLRLTTNGTPGTTAWDTDADFTNGVTHQGVTFPPVGVGTLSRTGSGPAATLTLPTTLLPLTLDAANPILGPTASTALDSDNVDDPALAKIGSTYVMWYAGTPEDGGPPAIFIATSTNGTSWTRGNGGAPVLQGSPLSFDQDGVYGPDVVYDPADPAAPYRMWYSGRAGVFGAIGYATSTDGVSWVKYPGQGQLPLAVLTHGPAGSADSFSAGVPSVLKDGTTWKMWYTGDDSSKKRIAYATSTDGVNWAKGGKVIAPEDPGVSANIAFGAFAPTVWKTGSTYSMLLTGRKLVGQGVFQTKIMGTSSSDGVTWAGPSPVLNPSGSPQNFDYSTLNSPDVLQA